MSRGNDGRGSNGTEDGDHAGTTKYRPIFAKQVYELRLLGLTDVQIGKVLDVDSRTINRWRANHPAFAKAYREGGVIADGPVASALRKRALGYTYKTQKPVHVWNRETKSHDVLVIEVEETLPPDVNAAKSWLSARWPEVWREHAKVSLGGIPGAPLQVENLSARETLLGKFHNIQDRQQAITDQSNSTQEGDDA